MRDQQTLTQALGDYKNREDGQPSMRSVLDRFSPVHLHQLGKAALMDRQETKYIFHGDQILDFLPDLLPDYRILQIEGLRICRYQTVYFDTEDFLLFRQHQNGAGRRWKIRQRTYLDSHQNFLEVKYKDNRRRTKKSRMQTDIYPILIPEVEGAFLTANAPISCEEIRPALEVLYKRITLVKNDNRERITLDSQLRFSNGLLTSGLDGLMISEVKQAGYDPRSPFMSRIKRAGIRPSAFSKYCVGISLLYPAIKHNRFKPTIHKVNRLLEGDIDHERTQ